MSIDVPAGTVMSGYRVERLIGRGATGAVYLAHDEHLDRAVALKVLAPELARDTRFRERFLRESRVAAVLDNPHIVPIYAAGEADGALFLAMRYVDGSDLGDVVTEAGRLDAERTLAILRQVAEALDAAHSQDLIHRDVKPANIVVASGDRAFLCDFGLAKHAATINSLSRDTAFAGTIDYIAPEQIRGADIDGRADIYALGCVLFECLTGRPPFDRDTDLSIVFAHLNEPPPSLSALRPDLPAEVDAAVNRALAKEPADRFRTCGELIESFRAALGGEGPAVVTAQPGSTQLRTFLIADVRGYTRYTQQYGDEAAAELASNFANLVRRVVTARDGRLIELRGDEALVVFESARQALRAGIEIQAAVAEAGLPRGVGIGLDAGEAVPVGKGYRGGALNMAARLCSLAQPGEVLASDGVTHLARKVDGIRYLEGRLERLKGLDHPVRVVEVVPHHRGDALIGRLRRRTHGRPWLTLWAPIAVLVAILAATAAVLLTGSSAPHRVPGTLHAVNVIDVKSGAYRGAAASGVQIYRVFTAGDTLWGEGDGVLYKIDPATRKVQRTLPIGAWTGLAVGDDGAIWIAAGEHPTLIKVDPRFATVKRMPIPLAGLDKGDNGGHGVGVGAGSVWVGQEGQVIRIDPITGKLQGEPIQLPFSPDLVKFGDGAVFSANQGEGEIAKIEPTSGQIVWKTRLHPWLPDILPASGFLWVTVDSDAGVHKLDERTGQELGLVHTGNGSDALSYDGARVWVDNWRSYTITSIDPIAGGTRGYRLAGNPTGPVAVVHGRVWAPVQGTAKDLAAAVPGKVVRVVQREDWTSSFDPAQVWDEKHWELAYAVDALLFNYHDPDTMHTGAELTPELSAGWPKISADGRTYTFAISDRFRFSPPSNERVTAAAVRYSIERAVSGPFAGQFLSDIVGEDAFTQGKAQHMTGLVAHGNTLVIRLTKSVPDLPAILAMPFFAVVPMGTPLDGLDIQATPIPSAGPYYVESSNDGWWRIVKRNPNYGGDRPQRLDAIVFEMGIDTGPAAKRIENGTLDYASESFPDAGVFTAGGQISVAYGGARREGRAWWTSIPAPSIRFFAFNADGAFSDPRLRRAVAYALDRPALAAVNGGRPWDRELLPALPGVGNEHVYPLAKPSAADLRRALKLTGGRHLSAVLATCAQSDCAERANILRQNLATIGIRLKVHVRDDHYGNPGAFDIIDAGWVMDEFDPKNIFQGAMFDPNQFGALTGFSDPAFRARADAAAQLPPATRYDAFRRLDLSLLRSAAPWAVFEQPGNPAMFSARVGCLRFSPVISAVDLAALCLN